MCNLFFFLSFGRSFGGWGAKITTHKCLAHSAAASNVHITDSENNKATTGVQFKFKFTVSSGLEPVLCHNVTKSPRKFNSTPLCLLLRMLESAMAHIQ